MLKELALKFRFLELPCIEDVVQILIDNTDGQVWMLGGGISRQLINKHWSTQLPHRDLDFLAIKTSKKLRLPHGWEAQSNSYGSYKLRHEDIVVDLWSKAQQHSITSRGLKFNIRKVLEFSPLTIQSIAYDVERQEVFGDTGLQAILDRTVKVNNQQQVEHYCRLKQISVREFIEQKAAALGFTPVYP